MGRVFFKNWWKIDLKIRISENRWRPLTAFLLNILDNVCSSGNIAGMCLLIMLDTLLLRPSLHLTQLHLTPLHHTCRHFTSFNLNFTQLHFTTLSFDFTTFKSPTAPFHLTSLHFTSLQFTALLDYFRHTSTPFISPRLYCFTNSVSKNLRFTRLRP